MNVKRCISVVLIIILNFSLALPIVEATNEISSKNEELSKNVVEENNTNIANNTTNNNVTNTVNENNTTVPDNESNQTNSSSSDNTTENTVNTVETNTTITDGNTITQTIESQLTNEVKITDVEDKNTEFYASINVSGYQINTYLQDGIYYLFVSKGADITKLEIKINYFKKIVNTTSGQINTQTDIIVNDFSTNDTITITAEDNTKYTIKVMQSDIPSLCINLSEDVSLSQINSGSKETKYKASLQITGAETDKYNIEDSNITIKGRGNTTWQMPKKPYQISLSKKKNLLGIGNGESKKWILLANYYDRTLMRNKIMNEAQKNVRLTNVMNSEFTDLYINGEYVGNYLLCDKIEIGTNRINLKKPDAAILELDNPNGESEDYYFRSKITNTLFVLKETNNDEDDIDYNENQNDLVQKYKNYIDEFETLIYAEDPDWNKISEKIDVESFIKYYFLTELAEDPDRFNTSTFMYKDGEDDKLHMGPVWDSDLSFGYNKETSEGGNASIDYNVNYSQYRNYTNWYTKLYENNEFSKLLNQEYTKTIKHEFEKIENSINNVVNSMNESIEMNFVRWNNIIGSNPEFGTSHEPYNTYKEEVDYFKNWIISRVSYLNQRYSKDTQVMYSAGVEHLEKILWTNWEEDGKTVGTVGKALPMQSLKINIPNFDISEHIEYCGHVSNIGWTDWKNDGQTIGIEGENLEAVKINLKNINEYTIKYRVHVRNIGWMPWVSEGKEAGTTGKNLPIEAIEIKVEQKQFLGKSEEKLETAQISYKAHMENIGWSNWGADGETIGTIEESRKIEAIKISTNNLENAKIKYKTHVQDYGWQEWAEEDEEAGTTGKNKKIEAIQIKLENTEKYNIKYRVYVQDYGWMDWKQNGEIVGTTGENKRIEAIEIKIEQKQFLGKSEEKLETAQISYKAHMENIGWSNWGADGETIGTIEESRKIEAIKISTNNLENAEIKYKTHVQDYGWQEWVKEDEESGTTGKNKKIEAIQIKLEDTQKYNVKYRVYVQDYGWMDWKESGEIAGTTGENRRIEAIEIKIE